MGRREGGGPRFWEGMRDEGTERPPNKGLVAGVCTVTPISPCLRADETRATKYTVGKDVKEITRSTEKKREK